jgi:hypothetical protein
MTDVATASPSSSRAAWQRWLPVAALLALAVVAFMSHGAYRVATTLGLV